MIASGYTMDIYCDSDVCKGATVFGSAKESFFGETWAQVARMARKVGWRITKDRKAFCPWCTGKKIRSDK